MEKPTNFLKEFEVLKQENLQLKKQIAINSTTLYKQEAILAGINVGTWDWNIQTGEVSFNSAWFSMLGYNETELEPVSIKTWETLAHPDDLKKSEEALLKHFNGDTEFYECEARLKNKNGNWVWVLDKGKVYEFDDFGKPLLMAGSHINIDDIKQKELKSKTEKELWLSIFEFNSSVMLIIKPDTGQIVDANISAANFYGYPLNNLLKMSIDQLNINCETSIEEIVYNQKEQRHFKHKLADNKICDIEMYLTPIFLENQEFMFAIIHDVSEKVKAEQELKKSELKYKSIIQTAIDGFIIVDEKGKILEVNEAYSNMLGYTIEEILTMNIMDINFRFTKANLESESKILKEKGFTRYTTQHKHRNGNLIDVEVSVNYNEFINGGVFFVFINDISERIQKEKELKIMHENYDRFFNTIDEFLFVLDEQGNILYTNQTVIDRLGYTEKEVIGNSVLNLHAPEDRSEALRIVVGMLNGEIDFCPLPLIMKNGMKIPVETRVTKGVWNGQKVIFGVSKDISLLKLSEEKFSKSFQINPIACGFSDISTGEYVEVNDAFCALLEFDRTEVIGKTPGELGILDEEIRNNILSKYKFDDKIINVEAKLKTKYGDTKCVLLSAQNIYLYDRSLRFTAAYDITEIKKVNEELKVINEELNTSKMLIESAYEENTKFLEELSATKLKLEKINTEKDKLFSIIAHDLRSPFQGFLGITEVLKEGVDDFSAQELKSVFDETNKSAQKIYDLLNNLLEWARMQRGLIKFEPSKIDVSNLINSNIALFSRNLLDKNIDVQTNLCEDDYVYADERTLNTISRNILSNAIKFTNRDGKIYINSKKTDDEFLEISISDNGIGMSNDLRKRIFLIGEKVGRKGTSGEESSGLGLALCKEFVEMNGGKIRVESVENEGTTFIFTVPLFR